MESKRLSLYVFLPWPIWLTGLTLSSVAVISVSAQNYFPSFPSHLTGDSSSSVPFSAGTNTAGRFQEVYDAAGFIDLAGNRPLWIRTIQFREDENQLKGFFSHFPDFQVNLSTTSRSVDGLSDVFSLNVGPDDRAVVGRGAFELGSDSSHGEFGVIIFLAQPSYYDPSQGDLLMDVRNFGGGRTSWGVPPFTGPAYVDASNITGDSVSSVYSSSVDAASGIASTLGLVTQFYVTPVPEPSTLGLLVLGLVVVGACWMRTRRE